MSFKITYALFAGDIDAAEKRNVAYMHHEFFIFIADT